MGSHENSSGTDMSSASCTSVEAKLSDPGFVQQNAQTHSIKVRGMRERKWSLVRMETHAGRIKHQAPTPKWVQEDKHVQKVLQEIKANSKNQKEQGAGHKHEEIPVTLVSNMTYRKLEVLERSIHLVTAQLHDQQDAMMKVLGRQEEMLQSHQKQQTLILNQQKQILEL